MSEVAKKARKAAGAQGATTLLAKALNLVFGIWLARILSPDDFGALAIAVLVNSFITSISNFGFQTYLIQRAENDDFVNDACYIFNLVVSSFLGLCISVTVLLWPGVDSGLKTMISLYGLNVILASLSYVPLALLKRELDFAKSARADLAASFSSSSLRVVFAAAGFGPLSFPCADLVASLVRNRVAAHYCRWRPRMSLPSANVLREVISFGVPTTLVSLASFAASQIDKLLVISTYPLAAVGHYSFGGAQAAMFYNALLAPQANVFMATFARLRDHLDTLRGAIFKSTRFVYSWALPFHLFLLLHTEMVIRVVFTEKWLIAAPLMKIFVIDYLFRSAFSGITAIQLAFGLAAAAARTKWINAGLFIGATVLAATLRATIEGYAVAAVSAGLLSTLHNIIVNGRVAGISWSAYFRNLMPPTIAAAIATFVAQTYIWAGPTPGKPWLQLLDTGLVFGASYLFVTFAVNREAVLWRGRPGISRKHV
jgi:O-antigen/teichoic acid export membrane protein